MSGTSSERATRSRQLLLAGALTIVSFALGSGYCLTTWAQPERPTMLLMYGIGLGLGVLVVAIAGRLAATARARRVVMLALTLSSVLLVSINAYLDGGADAPAVLGLLPPMVFVAITVPPRLQVGLQAYMVACYVVLALVGRPPRPGYVFLHFGGTLVIVGVCVAQARLVARQRAELRAVARIDPLTGALNRRALEEFAGPVQSPTSVVCVDFDGFKLVNDRLGHAAGDELLRWSVAAMHLLLGPGEVVARLGGDEFVIVLPGADAAAAAATAERVVAALRPRIGASVGTATAPADGITLEALMTRADHRLYDVKLTRREEQRV